MQLFLVSRNVTTNEAMRWRNVVLSTGGRHAPKFAPYDQGVLRNFAAFFRGRRVPPESEHEPGCTGPGGCQLCAAGSTRRAFGIGVSTECKVCVRPGPAQGDHTLEPASEEPGEGQGDSRALLPRDGSAA